MRIGCLDIYQKNSIYYINNENENENENKQFNILFHSFQLETNDFSSIFSLISLKEYLHTNPFNSDIISKFLKSLYKQINFIIERKYSISFIDISDIMVVDNDKFLFCNFEKLIQINNKKQIIITQTYDKKNMFIPPELMKNNIIPFSIPYTSFYYSLGSIIIYCLQYNYKHDNIDNKKLSYYEILQQHKYNKFYFTINNFFNIDPSNRFFILF